MIVLTATDGSSVCVKNRKPQATRMTAIYHFMCAGNTRAHLWQQVADCRCKKQLEKYRGLLSFPRVVGTTFEASDSNELTINSQFD